MNKFPFLIPILFLLAALILLSFAAILVGFVPFTTFNHWRGVPDIVRQFRQTPITGEVSPVLLDHLFADRGAAGFLQKVTDAAFSGDGHINEILACRRANCALPCGAARQQGIWT